MTPLEALRRLQFACDELRLHLDIIYAEHPGDTECLSKALCRRLFQFQHDVTGVLRETEAPAPRPTPPTKGHAL